MVTPRWDSSSLARVPAATRAAVSRAEARSSTSRASSKPYLSIPGRSACPGRGWVKTLEGAPGSGDISSAHFGHSVLAISMATGEPRVRPCLMPPRRVISSASKRMRGPRPKPSRRRANSPVMSDASTGRPAGRPSTITTRARPWDSPAVRKRSTGQRYRTPHGRLELADGVGPGRPGRAPSAVEGVLPTSVVGDVEHAGQLGHLFEQRRLDALTQRHRRHGAALAAPGEAEVRRAVVLVQGDQVGATAVAGDGRVDRLLEHRDDALGERPRDAAGQDLGGDPRCRLFGRGRVRVDEDETTAVLVG